MRNSTRRGGRLTPFVLLGLCLVLGYRLTGEHGLAAPDTAFPVADGPSQAVSVATAAPYAIPPLAELSETVGRPLFSPTRRPPEPETTLPEETPVQATSGELTLVGVVIAGENRIALVRQRNDSKLLRVVTAQIIAGWSVEEILPTSAILRRGDVRETLVLEDKIVGKPRPARKANSSGNLKPAQPVVRAKAGS